jgi:hypothetical protein
MNITITEPELMAALAQAGYLTLAHWARAQGSDQNYVQKAVRRVFDGDGTKWGKRRDLPTSQKERRMWRAMGDTIGRELVPGLAQAAMTRADYVAARAQFLSEDTDTMLADRAVCLDYADRIKFMPSETVDWRRLREALESILPASS